ncbi:MAG: MEKHLA domain-containing protein [Sphingobacteriia bacterium]|nr:MEKHLA domain-containing protein [Sphingobacteriia bacterium]NCC39333.1 MEKHLA domain-containing protein [Gammaproteobacteria bacterium]
MRDQSRKNRDRQEDSMRQARPSRGSIEGATVWNLIDEPGRLKGQAAIFVIWRHLAVILNTRGLPDQAAEPHNTKQPRRPCAAGITCLCAPGGFAPDLKGFKPGDRPSCLTPP